MKIQFNFEIFMKKYDLKNETKKKIEIKVEHNHGSSIAFQCQ